MMEILLFFLVDEDATFLFVAIILHLEGLVG